MDARDGRHFLKLFPMVVTLCRVEGLFSSSGSGSGSRRKAFQSTTAAAFLGGFFFDNTIAGDNSGFGADVGRSWTGLHRQPVQAGRHL